MPGKDRLSGLPSELRNCIYDYALVKRPDYETSLSTPALLQVNKRIRQEAVPIFYGRNTFFIDIPSDINAWPQYVRMCELQAQNLKHVTNLIAVYREDDIDWDINWFDLGFNLCSEDHAIRHHQECKINVDHGLQWWMKDSVENDFEDALHKCVPEEKLQDMKIRISIPRVVRALCLLARHCHQARHFVKLDWDYWNAY